MNTPTGGRHARAPTGAVTRPHSPNPPPTPARPPHVADDGTARNTATPAQTIMCSQFAPTVRSNKQTARYRDSGNGPIDLAV
jgi:hypothetical protein